MFSLDCLINGLIDIVNDIRWFDARLSRLLHKQKFTEAEKFAQQFNLDVEVKEHGVSMI